MRVLIAGKNELAVGLYETLMECELELGLVTCASEPFSPPPASRDGAPHPDSDAEPEAAEAPRLTLKGALAGDGVEPLNRSYTHSELLRVVQEWAPDVVISAGFDKIIKPEVIAAVPHVLNVHFGALPRYRGSFSIPWAILQREPVIGVTLHCVDPGIDSGAIVSQRHVPNDPSQSARDLYDACVEIGILMVEEWLFLCGTGHPPGATLQNEVDATYYPLEFPGGYRIEWQQTVRHVYDYIRACHFPPYRGARTILGGDEIEIKFPVSFECAPAGERCGTIADVVGRAGVWTLNGLIVPRRVVVNGQPRDFTAWVIQHELYGQVLGEPMLVPAS